MTNEFRVYNHSDRELLVQTDEASNNVYRLLPQCASPADKTPVYVWHPLEKISAQDAWRLTPGFDAHVYQIGIDNSIGDDQGILATVSVALHISGLHITGVGRPSVTTTASTPAWFYRTDEVWVTVLGAGITGLTVAHELVTRGFRVQVIERAHGSPIDAIDDEASRFQRGLDKPDVGGIARTQWSTQPLDRGGLGAVLGMGTSDTADPQPSALRSVHGDALWFGAAGTGELEFNDYHAFGIEWQGATMTDMSAAIIAWLDELSTTKGRSVAAIQLVVVVYTDNTDPAAAVRAAYARHTTFTGSIPATLRAVFDNLQILPTARIDVPEADPGGTRVGLLLRVHEDLGLVAGEHGFRFFPGFYRHLRDTMGRTPIFDSVTQTFTPRTALDNLETVAWQVIADPARKHQTALSRQPFDTIGGLIAQYREVRRDSGYRPIDLARFALRILRYMTSSVERRQRYYEHMTWWDFVSKIHLDDPTSTERFDYGQRFAEALKHAPKALVAMGSEKADARTQGNISVQLLMDQFGLHDQGDSTLVGPTSVSWLRHWRTYLEQQGVRFFLGEVTKIHTHHHRAHVEIVFPGGQPVEYLDGEQARHDKAIDYHYIVSALDVGSLGRVTRHLRRHANHLDLATLLADGTHSERDVEDITHLGFTQGAPFDDIGDRFQTLTGIQLYYKHHVSFANGHIYFAASPWGLSAISQVQFWGPFGSGHRGRLTGNLSIDIGSWRGDSTTTPPTPNPNTLVRDDIARITQEQINRCTNHGQSTSVRKATFYHLDDFITFALNGGAMLPSRNHAPFLINVVDDWTTRPEGEPWSPNDVQFRDRVPGAGTDKGESWFPDDGGYPVHYHNLVIAGTHLRTFTRLGTMEAANESGRHAVNSILDHSTKREPRPRIHAKSQPTPTQNVDKTTTPWGDYCDIWNPEECEFQDLDFARLIDKHLMTESFTQTEPDDEPPPDPDDARLAPHIFDILKVDELVETVDDDSDATRVLELIGSTLQAIGDVGSDDFGGVLSIVGRARRELERKLGRPHRSR